MLAKLKRADISRDPPAIVHVHAIGITVHRAKAIGDHLHHMSRRRCSQTIDVKRRRPRKSSPNHHAIAVAGVAVANRAIDVESLLATNQVLAGDGEGKIIGNGAGKDRIARNSAFRQRSRRVCIGEERNRLVWFDPAFVGHAAFVAGERHATKDERK
jgi:hypothetical protein